ncbi:hypothetical protein SAMN05421755_10988 [Nitrosomonas sp. Nm33]|nr:hypothetical protein SAMN05421755_10988 [Nitrosomonas sp. Nm33]
MNMHKHIRLTPLDRQELWQLYQTRCWKVSQLAERFRVSRSMIYTVLKRARLKEFVPRDSTNQRFNLNSSSLKNPFSQLLSCRLGILPINSRLILIPKRAHKSASWRRILRKLYSQHRTVRHS